MACKDSLPSSESKRTSEGRKKKMKIGSLGILSLHMPTTNSNPGRRKHGGNIMYHSVPLPSGFTKKTLPIQMISEASKMKLSEGCVYV